MKPILKITSKGNIPDELLRKWEKSLNKKYEKDYTIFLCCSEDVDVEVISELSPRIKNNKQ